MRIEAFRRDGCGGVEDESDAVHHIGAILKMSHACRLIEHTFLTNNPENFEVELL